jgi:hypothetical protein
MTDTMALRRRLETLEWLLERSIQLPFLRKRVGLDGLAGLIPIVGDVVGAALALYLIWQARQLGASPLTMLRMLGNVAMDTGIGAIPVVGDLWDFLFASNSRNLRLLKEQLEKLEREQGVIVGQRA